MSWRVLQAIACGGAFAVLRFANPPSLPACGFRWLTGSPCPFCGLTHALFALAKGDWETAVGLHALSPVIFGLFLGFTALTLVRIFRPGIRVRVPALAWYALGAMFLVYGLLRIVSGTPVHAQAPEAVPPPPKLFTFGMEFRGRLEAFTGQSFQPGNNDLYYLHRLRLTLGIQPLPWSKFVFQTQDSRAPGYPDPAPSTTVNPLDLRQGYVEFGTNPKAGWSLRAGRQEFIFGDERLVGAGNWGNVGRSFDAVRVTYARPGAKLDWFASSVVVTDKDAFDRSDLRNRLYGFYSSFTKLIPGSQIEPYFFWRSDGGYRNELKVRGGLDEITFGIRGVGKLPGRLDYGIETAGQSGRAAGAPITAWAGHFLGGYSLGGTDRAPRLVAQFNCASGDSDPRDGRVNTFDQLYPTNHFFYGIDDRMGWRNMREAVGGVQWKPLAKWRFGVDYHAFWLATVQDALYLDNGSASVRNPNATSRRVGDELDVTANYQPSEHFSLVLGYGHLFPGKFLRQSDRRSGVTSPYVMWVWRL